MVKTFCKQCSKEFETYPSRIGVSNYCSRDCYLKHNPAGFKKGHKCYTGKLSEETKRKISIAGKGLKKPKTQEWIDKIRKSLTGKKYPNRQGINCHLWKGGITPKNTMIRMSSELKEWRKKVYARDNWTCQKCGSSGKSNLHAHHIKSFSKYPEFRFDINNGITVCYVCHSQIHGRPIPKRVNL